MNWGGEATSTEYKYIFIAQAVVLTISSGRKKSITYLLFLGFKQVYEFRSQEWNN